MYFRSNGVQWPLRSGDTVRVRRGTETLGEISADLVINLVMHTLYSIQLQEKIRNDVQHGPMPLPEVERMPLALMGKAPVPVEVQEQRRAKRKGRSVVKALLLSLLLSGCYATDPAQWTHAPDEQTALKAAIYECKAHANAQRLYAAQFGGAVLPIVSLFTAPGVFRECMEAKGYRGGQ